MLGAPHPVGRRRLAISLTIVAWIGWCVAASAGDFVDGFDGSELGPGWIWLRESPDGWKLADGALRIRTDGSLWGKRNTQVNLLLRQLTDGSAWADRRFAVEVTVDAGLALDRRYEHGGLIAYWDDDHWTTLTQLNHVQDRTQKIMLVHESGGVGHAGQSSAVPYSARRVILRLVLGGGELVGFYRESDEAEWTRLGRVPSPRSGSLPRIGITAGDGVPEEQHWIRFDDFRVESVER